MMYLVRSMNPSLARASFQAALLLAAACLTGSPSQAGEAGTSFQVTVRLQPADGSCSASTAHGTSRLTCGPAVAASLPAGGGALFSASGAPLRPVGELVEVGAENYSAWLENNPVAWSERSSRRVVAGGREYVEMTIAW